MPDPLLTIRNHHSASCGDPPIIAAEGSNTYIGYNCSGCLSIVFFSAKDYPDPSDVIYKDEKWLTYNLAA
jgi:hypothetical protein